MTSDLISFIYPAPDGRNLEFCAAYIGDEFVFPFLEIAEALFYENADRLSPTCDEAHTRKVKFPDSRNARKCVTLAGLFDATPISRTDEGRQPATGPAAHFHRWLRTVVLPLLDPEAWPPREAEKSALWREWANAECERITRGQADVAWKMIDAPQSKPSHPLGRSTPQGFEFSAEAIDAVVKVKR